MPFKCKQAWTKLKYFGGEVWDIRNNEHLYYVYNDRNSMN